MMVSKPVEFAVLIATLKYIYYRLRIVVLLSM